MIPLSAELAKDPIQGSRGEDILRQPTIRSTNKGVGGGGGSGRTSVDELEC